MDLDLEMLANGVDHAHAYSMKPYVRMREMSILGPAMMQLAKDALDERPTVGASIERHAGAIVAHLHPAVGQKHHLDQSAAPGEMLVHAVADDFPQ